MRFNISREWCLKMAAVEAEIEGTLAAGTLALDPMLEINDSKEPLYAFKAELYEKLLRAYEARAALDKPKMPELTIEEMLNMPANLVYDRLKEILSKK